MEAGLESELPILLQGFQDLAPVFLAETDDWSWPAQEQTTNRHAVQMPDTSKASAARGVPKRSRSSRIEEDLLLQKIQALKAQEQQKQMLQERVKMLELMLNARNEQIQRLKAIQDGQANDVLEGTGISLERLKVMQPQDFARLAKEKMASTGAELLAAEGQAAVDNGAALQAFAQSYQKKRLAMKYAALIRPDKILIAGRNINEMETFSSPELASLAPESHWVSVVEQLGLDERQALQSWLLADLHAGWHKRLMADRSVLTSQLAQTLNAQQQYSQACQSTNALISNQEQTVLVDKLASSLMKERLLMILVSEVFFLHVLPPLQLARASVCSYPYMPDEVALLAAAAALYKDGSQAPGASCST